MEDNPLYSSSSPASNFLNFLKAMQPSGIEKRFPLFFFLATFTNIANILGTYIFIMIQFSQWRRSITANISSVILSKCFFNFLKSQHLKFEYSVFPSSWIDCNEPKNTRIEGNWMMFLDFLNLKDCCSKSRVKTPYSLSQNKIYYLTT